MQINSYNRVQSAYPNAVSATSRVRRVDNERAAIKPASTAHSADINDVVSISSAGRAYIGEVKSLQPIKEVAKVTPEIERTPKEASKEAKIEGRISIESLNEALGLKPKTQVQMSESMEQEETISDFKRQNVIATYTKIMDMAKPVVMSGQLMQSLI